MSRELPGNVPFAVKKEMIQNFIQLWREPADALLNNAYSTISCHFSALCKQHFKDYETLRNLVMCVTYLTCNNAYWQLSRFSHSAELIGHRLTCDKAARDRVNWIIDMEHQATFTLNHLCHLSYRDNFQAFYRAARWSQLGLRDAFSSCYHKSRNETHVEKRQRLVDRLNSGHPTDIPDLLELIPSNPSDTTIGIIADVRAYWQSKFKHALVNFAVYSSPQSLSNAASIIFL